MTNISAISPHGRRGDLGCLIQAENPHKIIASAPKFVWFDSKRRIRLASDEATAGRALSYINTRDHLWQRGEDLMVVFATNAYVNTGLNNSLDREFALGGSGIGFFGVSSNSTAVAATTVFLNGGSGGAAANTMIKAISPSATRSSQTTTAGTTFVNADFTSGVFIINKMGLLTTSTDAGTGLVDVVGGAGGSSPYNRTLSLDLTAAGSFTITPQLAITAVAV